ncbi:MAG: hypothetical protein Q4C49_00925 [Bacillota bacterium]|nr:hypothetical protein [Bacillota bacterium]
MMSQQEIIEQTLLGSKKAADRAFHQRIAGDLFVEGAKHRTGDELKDFAKECFDVATYLTSLYE